MITPVEKKKIFVKTTTYGVKISTGNSTTNVPYIVK